MQRPRDRVCCFPGTGPVPIILYGRSKEATGFRYVARVPVDDIDCFPPCPGATKRWTDAFQNIHRLLSLSCKSMSNSWFQPTLAPGGCRARIPCPPKNAGTCRVQTLSLPNATSVAEGRVCGV